MLWVTVLWTAAGVLVYLWAPLTASYLLPLTFVAPALWAWEESGRLPFYRPSTFCIVLTLAAVYLLINASWSINPPGAYAAIGLCFLFIGSLHLTLQSLDRIETPPLQAMANGLVLAMMIGGALLFLEVVSQQWLHRQLMYYLPWFRPHPRHMATVNNVVVYLQPYLLNRSMAALTLLFWPCVFCIALLPHTPADRRWRLAALLFAVAAIFLSKHATSKITLVGSTAVFAAMHWFPLAAKRAVIWGWVAAILLVVPLAALAYRGELYLSDYLAHSAQHRIVIWGTTTQEIVKTPLLGAGIYATRGSNEPESFDAALRTRLQHPDFDRPAQPQRLPADLVRGRRRRRADPARRRSPDAEIAVARPARRPALPVCHLRCLRPDGRLELQLVAVVVPGLVWLCCRLCQRRLPARKPGLPTELVHPRRRAACRAT